MVILVTSINMPIIRLLDSKLASLIAFALACKIVALMMRGIILVMICLEHRYCHHFWRVSRPRPPPCHLVTFLQPPSSFTGVDVAINYCDYDEKKGESQGPASFQGQ